MSRSFFAIVLSAASLAACTPDRPSEVDDAQARRMLVEVDFMPGAQPGVATPGSPVDPWLVFQWNLTHLLPPEMSEVSLPRTLDQMGQLSASTLTSFSRSDLFALDRTSKDVQPGEDDRYLHVLFVAGEFAEAGDDATIKRAVYLDDELVVVFGGVGPQASDLEKLEEQTALLHEVGHAFGLTGLGVNEVHPHSDGNGHCTNDDCAMRATSTLSPALLDHLSGGDVPVLFGQHCLDDLEAHYSSGSAFPSQR